MRDRTVYGFAVAISVWLAFVSAFMVLLTERPGAHGAVSWFGCATIFIAAALWFNRLHARACH